MNLDVIEDTPILIEGITISDIDINQDGEGILEVNIFTEEGSLNFLESEGINYLVKEDSSVSFEGTLEAINKVFKTIQYFPKENSVDSDLITINVSDNGNSGGDGSDLENASASIFVSISPVNDPTEITIIPSQVSIEDEEFVLDASNYFHNVDGDQLIFNAEGLPEGLTINSTTGLIEGTVGNDDVGFYAITLNDDYHKTVEEVMFKLGEYKIGTRPFFYPMHKQPVFNKMKLFLNDRLPSSEKLYKKGFYIPSGLALAEDQIKEVSVALHKIFAS